jgi:hypothetical protein
MLTKNNGVAGSVAMLVRMLVRKQEENNENR